MTADLNDPRAAAAARIHLDALSGGDLDCIAQLVSDDYVAHLLPPDTPKGPAGLQGLVREARSAFPDLSYSVDHAVVSGDTVALHVTGRGTNQGPLRGAPATGRTAQWSEMHFLRFDGDRVAEHWGVVDQLSALMQLGGVRSSVPTLVVDAAAMQVEIPDTARDMVADISGYGS